MAGHGHHDARDGLEIPIERIVEFLLVLRSQEVYGEIWFKVRRGRVVGQVHEQRDYLVDSLPRLPATPEHHARLAEALTGVSFQAVRR